MFQQYYDKIDEDIILLADNDDMAELDEIFDNQNDFTDDPDNWGEPIDFTIEEMLDMPTEGEVQMNLTNTNCVGQDELYKVVYTPTGVHTKTGDYREPDYIETNNESHGENNNKLFCVTGKDLDFIDIDIDDLF